MQFFRNFNIYTGAIFLGAVFSILACSGEKKGMQKYGLSVKNGEELYQTLSYQYIKPQFQRLGDLNYYLRLDLAAKEYTDSLKDKYKGITDGSKEELSEICDSLYSDFFKIIEPDYYASFKAIDNKEMYNSYNYNDIKADVISCKLRVDYENRKRPGLELLITLDTIKKSYNDIYLFLESFSGRRVFVNKILDKSQRDAHLNKAIVVIVKIPQTKYGYFNIEKSNILIVPKPNIPYGYESIKQYIDLQNYWATYGVPKDTIDTLASVIYMDSSNIDIIK